MAALNWRRTLAVLPIEPLDEVSGDLMSNECNHTGIGGLVAAIKIDGEFLAPNGWKVEGKRCIVGHGGCGAGLTREATCRNNDFATAVAKILMPDA